MITLESSRIPCERSATGFDTTRAFHCLFEDQPIALIQASVGFPQNFGSFAICRLTEVMNITGHLHQLAQGQAAEFMNNGFKDRHGATIRRRDANGESGFPNTHMALLEVPYPRMGGLIPPVPVSWRLEWPPLPFLKPPARRAARESKPPACRPAGRRECRPERHRARGTCGRSLRAAWPP